MEQLKYSSIFDIIGPIMIGPSSSHTAGAARIGKVVRKIFGERPDTVDIYLYESFAKTYRGHGTDIALVGGLLGMEPEDPRLSDSLKIAYEAGMEILFVPKQEKAEHPNMVQLKLTRGNHVLTVTGISIGGGNIQISEVNGFKLSLSLGMPTFVIVHQDVPGMIAHISQLFFDAEVNIGTMSVSREAVGEKAITVIETDERNEAVQNKIKAIDSVFSVSYFE
ncbi:L-serine ammonia-lyase, iron-sulfur-dependent subunit beta [Enterococcus pallens]|uniref:L-serine deaminase n=1 Tax=Enterococcus pallens ATCC BAA-351 TaxID=1158607 RepID=R2SDA4_9ENTE|nr:L-serine ammonia-lyase, iron-sulfur-dependent subunit beta [Enterococcus pallens]EOH90856.1 L-serine dehydratase, iron-sulfur-dependent, beta subunit [Enterococcus pallens ATCC BAA-351]EOU16052.1 L-serine dehydratase, iron-sulfur-dependent, beta subunit [Enterococcus pallens ATCC BAA-351]OJG77490.1 L-serine dehydratase, iron-sulfur-dependent, beta subunit [Enterococcus pallens]